VYASGVHLVYIEDTTGNMTEQKIVYRLVKKKNSISVCAGDTITCQIDNDFAKKAGYKNALEYCEKVFL